MEYGKGESSKRLKFKMTKVTKSRDIIPSNFCTFIAVVYYVHKISSTFNIPDESGFSLRSNNIQSRASRDQ